MNQKILQAVEIIQNELKKFGVEGKIQISVFSFQQEEPIDEFKADAIVKELTGEAIHRSSDGKGWVSNEDFNAPFKLTVFYDKIPFDGGV